MTFLVRSIQQTFRARLWHDSPLKTSLFLWLIAVLFVFSNAVSLSFVENGRFAFPHFSGPIIWFIVHGLALFLLHKFKPTFDPIILALLSLLSGWGILLIDRLAANFLSRQIAWVVLGTAVVILITILPKSLIWLRKYRYSLLTVGLLLLATTFFFGVNPSGATSANYWLRLPFNIPVFFQPSELLKLLLVIFLASYFDEQAFINQSFNKKRNLLVLLAPIAIMGGFCLLLLVWQQDLGAATLFFILFLALFYVATGKRSYLLTGGLFLLVAGIFAYYQFDVVALRVDAWLNPWPDADGRAFQIVQSLYAIAAGGIFGQGIGQGFPEYIPVVHSDFVFAAIAEEWGLIGSLTILFCFILLMHRGLKIAIGAKRPFHRYLATGITTLLSAQAILIMGGVTKLLPLTGVTLPFVSYGGSSMLVSHIMAGLLLYLSTQPQSATHLSSPITVSQKHLRKLHLGFLSAFALVAVGLMVWPLVQASNVLGRDDNPRQVETALRVLRGLIVDANGVVLAQTVGNGNDLTRQYPIESIGPAVGYYSFKHGTAGVEAGFDTYLGGAESVSGTRFFEQDILHRPAVGQNIQLTLISEYQEMATGLMATQTGGLVLFRLTDEATPTADIVSLVSTPSYNPNLLDEQFELLIEDDTSPLLNRTTQGQYQPGMILQPFVLATAVHRGTTLLNQSIEAASAPVRINNHLLYCEDDAAEVTRWAGVLKARCPAPMALLGNQMGVGELEQSFMDFGFTRPLTLPLGLEETAVSPIESPDLAAIGQDSLTISPIVLGRAWMTLFLNGRLPTLRIASHIQQPGGPWQPLEQSTIDYENAISPSVATAIRNYLPKTDDGIVAFSGTAVSGPENSLNSWYMGQIEVEDAQYFVVLILENSTSIETAVTIGETLLRQID